MTSFLKYILGSVGFGTMVLSSVVFGDSADITLFEGDKDDHFHISGDPSLDNISLFFGDSLSHFLEWDVDSKMFVFSHNVSFGGNQLLDMRIENRAEEPDCTLDSAGRLYFNTNISASYVCNGVRWKQIDEERNDQVAPYVSSLTPSFIRAGEETILSITGGGFSLDTTVVIPGMEGLVDQIEVISPTELSIRVFPSESSSGDFDILLQNNGVSNVLWEDNGVGMLSIEPEIILLPRNQGDIIWERAQGVNTDEGSLFPNSDQAEWERGASFGSVPENVDFVLSFTPAYMPGYSSGGHALIGVDGADPDHNYTTIDYAFFIINGSQLYIYENGESRGSVGNFEQGQSLSILREKNQISYAVDGEIVYTSDVVSTGSVVFDSSLYQFLGAKNIQFVY